MNIQHLNEPINLVKKLIVEIREDNSAPSENNSLVAEGYDNLVFFSVAGKGGVTLFGEDLDKFERCIESISNCINGEPAKRKTQALNSGQLSVKTITSHVENAILTALNIDLDTGQLVQEEAAEFERRLTATLQSLRSQLIAPSLQWDIYLPLRGILLRDECFSFGGVRFLPNNKQNRRMLRRQSVKRILDRSDSIASKRELIKVIRELLCKSAGVDNAIAFVQVEAVDDSAAFLAAREITTRAIEVLNFYAFGQNSVRTGAHAFFPGEAEVDTRSTSFALNNIGGVKFNLTSNLPNELFHLSRLNGRVASDSGLTRMSLILERSRSNVLGTFEKRLLGSFRFAGRAMAENVREEAFLHHAVALECLLGDSSPGTDITYKLSTRCAHLLGNSIEKRREIQDKIKAFYKIRSKIVHSGEDTVTEGQLSEFRQYVWWALSVASTDYEFTSVRDEKVFLDLLETRILS